MGDEQDTLATRRIRFCATDANDLCNDTECACGKRVAYEQPTPWPSLLPSSQPETPTPTSINEMDVEDIWAAPPDSFEGELPEAQAISSRTTQRFFYEMKTKMEEA